MSSTSYVDFSVRQNKAIERRIVFDGLHRTLRELEICDPVYVGFGSVWFTDFMLAHRQLGVQTMISIENDPVVYARAVYNAPLRTIEVIHGASSDVIPHLLSRDDLAARPWIVWLDFDKHMSEPRLLELTYLVENLPEDSILLTTFSAGGRAYGHPRDRNGRLKQIFGDAVDDESFKSLPAANDERQLMNVLSAATRDTLVAHSLQIARPGGFLPAFELQYQDGTPMVTVGGILPSLSNALKATELVNETNWPARLSDPVITPPLTSKEVSTLQAQLPSDSVLTRALVKRLGFDLEDAQLQAYSKHYLEYPQFAQVSY